MDILPGVAMLEKCLRRINWEWKRATMESVPSELGLIDPTIGSDTWVGYRSPDPEFPSGLLKHPYGFSFRGQQLLSFNIHIDSIEMGELCLYEPDRYNEVCEQGHVKFRANFRKAVRRITRLLGNPLFQGKGGDDDKTLEAYPLGWGGEECAVWKLRNARLILVYGQEDKELPIMLDLYVCPPKE